MFVDNTADTDEMCRCVLRNQIAIMEGLKTLYTLSNVVDAGERRELQNRQAKTQELLERR